MFAKEDKRIQYSKDFDLGLTVDTILSSELELQSLENENETTKTRVQEMYDIVQEKLKISYHTQKT